MARPGTSLSPSPFKMPFSFSVAVLAWAVVFSVVIFAFGVLYTTFLVYGVSSFIEASGGDTKKWAFPLIMTLTGGFLLLVLIKATFERPRIDGVPLAPDVLGQFQELVQQCARDAGVPAPDAILLTPTVCCEAYSSGPLEPATGFRSALRIGTPLLALASETDLTSVIFHEFAHLTMRRQLWATSISYKLWQFCSRFVSAHRGVGCWTWVLTIPPLLVTVALFKAFALTMAGFRRREEYLADSFAANYIGNAQFCHSLVAVAGLMHSLESKDGREPALSALINAEFHAKLLSPESATTTPNWFATARDAIGKHWPTLVRRFRNIIVYYEVERQSVTDTHPPLRDRVRRLQGFIGEAQDYLPDLDRTVYLPEPAERILSDHLTRLHRHDFYEAKREAGMNPLEGVGTTFHTAFACTYTPCPRCGQYELTLTDELLTAYTDDGELRLPWSDIKSIGIDDAASFTNLFIDLMRPFWRFLRDRPDERTLTVNTQSGLTVTLQHWHCVADTAEIEALLKLLSTTSPGTRRFNENATRSDREAAAPMAAQIPRSKRPFFYRPVGCILVVTACFAANILGMFVLHTMVGNDKVASTVQTLTIVAMISYTFQYFRRKG
ncbi:MAG: hypothetical protein EXQ52_11455 [Bryobacterales bacterium]|nr:hypothetical protein [Bryobacterales bacterium]